MLKNYLFYGYTKASVKKELDKLYNRIEQLEEDLAAREQIIDDLTDQLHRAKSQERLIQEAVIDAKKLSKRIIKQAQEQAEVLMTYVEDDVNTKLDKISHNIHSIKQNKETMLNQEAIARQQLKDSLNHYLALIDQHSEQFAAQNNILEVDFKRVQDSLSQTRTVLNRATAEQKEALVNSANKVVNLK